jgi:hypothetical protein
LVSLSLAINHALGGRQVWGYHAFNLIVHLLAGLTLFGIVRRTLLSPRLAGRFGGSAGAIAVTSALIWTVHPLNTQAVTYVVQRAESMMGLAYLLTLYCAIRGFGTRGHRSWSILAAIACAAGAACKETMATAPVMVLLYEWLFGSRGWKEIFRRRWRFHGALAATWMLMAALVWSQPRGQSAGFGVPITPWQYARTQFGVITHYLRLAFWPGSLTVDYGWPIAEQAGEILPYGILVAALISLSAWALVHRMPAGYLSAGVFIILLPTSSIIPIADPAFEHRMYLPLAAIVVLVVATGYRIGQNGYPLDSTILNL